MSLLRPDEYPRETKEFIPVVDLLVDGDPYTEDFEVAVVHLFERPESDDWDAAITLGSEKGFMLDGPALGIGTYDVYVRVTDSPEVPVFMVGRVRLT